MYKKGVAFGFETAQRFFLDLLVGWPSEYVLYCHIRHRSGRDAVQPVQRRYTQCSIDSIMHHRLPPHQEIRSRLRYGGTEEIEFCIITDGRIVIFWVQSTKRIGCLDIPLSSWSWHLLFRPHQLDGGRIFRHADELNGTPYPMLDTIMSYTLYSFFSW